MPQMVVRRPLDEIERVWLLFGNELPPLDRVNEALLVLINMVGPVFFEML
jgi:hypothetical protein